MKRMISQKRTSVVFHTSMRERGMDQWMMMVHRRPNVPNLIEGVLYRPFDATGRSRSPLLDSVRNDGATDEIWRGESECLAVC